MDTEELENLVWDKITDLPEEEMADIANRIMQGSFNPLRVFKGKDFKEGMKDVPDDDISGLLLESGDEDVQRDNWYIYAPDYDELKSSTDLLEILSDYQNELSEIAVDDYEIMSELDLLDEIEE